MNLSFVLMWFGEPNLNHFFYNQCVKRERKWLLEKQMKLLLMKAEKKALSRD
nr:MAG TPA: hypothetical protein [Caudoviricetes sp.]